MNKKAFSKPCRACGEQIIFIQTKKGKWMPCEIDYDFHVGPCTIVTEEGDVVKLKENQREHGYTPHWQNCEDNGNEFRR